MQKLYFKSLNYLKIVIKSILFEIKDLTFLLQYFPIRKLSVWGHNSTALHGYNQIGETWRGDTVLLENNRLSTHFTETVLQDC